MQHTFKFTEDVTRSVTIDLPFYFKAGGNYFRIFERRGRILGTMIATIGGFIAINDGVENVDHWLKGLTEPITRDQFEVALDQVIHNIDALVKELEQEGRG